MEIEDAPKINSICKKFVFILLLMFNLIAISIVCLIIILNGQNEYFFKLIFIIMIMVLFSAGLLLLGIIPAVVLLWYEHPISKIFGKLLNSSLAIIYPGIFFTSKLLKCDKDFTKKVFIELNNKLVSINRYSMEGDDILVLIPHCIQKSFCPHRITINIGNCRRCGKCNIGDLMRLKEEFGINVKVVTGGTLARKVVKDLKPGAIVAIACERDLISGLRDVRNLPVIAITNKRPEGPCMNTSVNIDEVRTAIKHFLCEE